MQRRQFLKSAVAIGTSSTLVGTTGCSTKEIDPLADIDLTQADFEHGKPLPWINWAGNESCIPNWRLAPKSEDELVGALKIAKGSIRAVGAGHSFSGVVPTNDTLISTDHLAGLVRHDTEKMQATFQAGTRMHAMGPLLQSIGQAMQNMPDMDYPAIGGAIATSVHATGNEFGSMSSTVTEMKIATVSGDLIECSAIKNPQIFQAARASIGSLGIVTEITLQNQKSYNLTEINKIENTEEVLNNIEARCKAHRHFELLPIPYTSLCVTVATDIAKPGDENVGEDDPQAVNTLRDVFDSVAWIPLIGKGIYDRALKLAFSGEADTRRTGPSYKVFPHTRVVRFREMEYTVPAELGPACIREILKTIEEQNLPLAFPIEYRYTKADDIWLSMFEGQNGCSISIHQFGDLDYKTPFAVIERIFWKYSGRPHWGKIHTLGANHLKALYPKHWQDFHEVRKTLDPQGRLLNKHLRELFGS